MASATSSGQPQSSAESSADALLAALHAWLEDCCATDALANKLHAAVTTALQRLSERESRKRPRPPTSAASAPLEPPPTTKSAASAPPEPTTTTTSTASAPQRGGGPGELVLIGAGLKAMCHLTREAMCHLRAADV
eukprot:6287199-Prymnesium_polylepis.1